MRTLMTRKGINTVYRKPRISHWNPAHTVYPYLLRDLTITRSDHVWAADITYIPMTRGFVYLFAVLDWGSRRMLAWPLSNTPDHRLLSEGGPGGAHPVWRPGHLQY